MKHEPHNSDEDLQKADRIAYLIAGHLSNSLSTEERQELDAWIVESDENLELFEKLTDEDNIELALQQYRRMEEEKRAAFDRVRQKIAREHKSWFKRIGPYLVAACLLTVAVYGYWAIQGRESLNDNAVSPLPRKEDVPPGSDKAVLTLSDGRTIILDSTAKGLLAEDMGAKVLVPSGGTISYEGIVLPDAGYHTLSIPRGGQYQLLLPDGSKVWLNAESSIRFPLAFAKGERRVELRGEGYFEVQKDAYRPFVVSVSSGPGLTGEVKVLGTHFNIDAYGDEAVIKTTLLEGSVQVEIKGNKKLLQPGEQALMGKDIKIVKADVAAQTAWKEGKFLFRDATIKSMGEQIRRWYDVDVRYEGRIDQHFNTEMPRDLPLSRVLEIFEKTRQVHFDRQGKKLVIRP